MLFDCTLVGAEGKKTTILPLEHTKRPEERGKTHLRFVWCNHFLQRVYSQAFGALFCYCCTPGERGTLIFAERPVDLLCIRCE